MDFRFISKNIKKYPTIFFIQKRFKGYWLPTYNTRKAINWYLIGVLIQVVFGLLFGFLVSLGKSNSHFYDLVISNSYVICAITFPLIQTLILNREICHIYELGNGCEIKFYTEKSANEFNERYKNLITYTDQNGQHRTGISKNELFLSEKHTFWGKNKKMYHVGIKQLRREKLEQLFS